jgi:hypothetical protein
MESEILWESEITPTLAATAVFYIGSYHTTCALPTYYSARVSLEVVQQITADTRRGAAPGPVGKLSEKFFTMNGAAKSIILLLLEIPKTFSIPFLLYNSTIRLCLLVVAKSRRTSSFPQDFQLRSENLLK